MACLSVMGLLLLLVAGIGLFALGGAGGDVRKVGMALSLTHDAMEAKFHTADVVGCQTGYAFDSLRGVPDAAEDSTGSARSSCSPRPPSRRT